MGLVRRSTSPNPNAFYGVQNPANCRPKPRLTLVKAKPPCGVGGRSFIDEIWLPDFVRSSAEGKANLKLHPRAEVRSDDYICINPSFRSGRMHNALTFDIDCNNGVAAFLELFEDTGIHFSMLVGEPFTDEDIMADLERGGYGQHGLKRLHATILLERGVPECDRRAYYLLKVIYHNICERLRQYGAAVDRGQKVSTKNPESPRWAVISGTRKKTSLYELAALLELDVEEYKKMPRQYRQDLSWARRGAQEDADATGRNCGAWEACRWIAYQSWSSFRSEERFIEHMILEVNEHNQLHNAHNPMSVSECQSIARSIARWTWKHQPDPATYKNRGAAREYMHAGNSRKRRQAIGALYANSKQVEANAKKISAAREFMKSQGEVPTKKGVARLTELSVNTVRAHWDGHASTSRERLDSLRQGVCVRLPSDSQSAAQRARMGVKMVHSEIGPIKKSTEDTGATYKKGEQPNGEEHKETLPVGTGNLIRLGNRIPLAVRAAQRDGGQVIPLSTGISPPRDAEGNVIRRDHTDPPF
ncbi:primase C-terminal domain-containing protein (plasmid) [Limimaricola variabilis]